MYWTNNPIISKLILLILDFATRFYKCLPIERTLTNELTCQKKKKSLNCINTLTSLLAVKLHFFFFWLIRIPAKIFISFNSSRNKHFSSITAFLEKWTYFPGCRIIYFNTVCQRAVLIGSKLTKLHCTTWLHIIHKLKIASY